MSDGQWQQYEQQWADCGRRQTLMYACWIGGAVLAAVLSGPYPRLFDFFAFLWVVGTFVSAHRLCQFRCPRCGQPFFVRGSQGGLTKNYTNPYTGKCLNCGLPKWQQHA